MPRKRDAALELSAISGQMKCTWRGWRVLDHRERGETAQTAIQTMRNYAKNGPRCAGQPFTWGIAPEERVWEELV
jgi:hypothetical protein